MCWERHLNWNKNLNVEQYYKIIVELQMIINKNKELRNIFPVVEHIRMNIKHDNMENIYFNLNWNKRNLEYWIESN